MSEVFRTRFGRWLHCLVNWHRPLTGVEPDGKSLYGCLDCLLAAGNRMARLFPEKCFVCGEQSDFPFGQVDCCQACANVPTRQPDKPQYHDAFVLGLFCGWHGSRGGEGRGVPFHAGVQRGQFLLDLKMRRANDAGVS